MPAGCAILVVVATSDHPFERDPAVLSDPDIEGPSLTDEMVARAQETLGRSLPSSYLELMRRCNGGYLRDTCIPTSRPTSWAPDHVSVSTIFGVPAVDDNGRFGTGAGILSTQYLISEWGLPNDVVLLDGDGHAWTALDYRGTGEGEQPSVVWLDVERGDELTIASSFDELIRSLRPDTDFLDDG